MLGRKEVLLLVQNLKVIVRICERVILCNFFIIVVLLFSLGKLIHILSAFA